jgi:hypothetical protein
VRDRLLPILDAAGDRRIDLIIGSHYDEDHLNGLVPIIEDQSIAIGEAWMPPTANDSVPHPLDAMLSGADLLPQQFYGEGADETLDTYLQVKRADCETLLVLEGRSDLNADEGLHRRHYAIRRSRPRNEAIGFFRTQLAELVPEGECDHGTDQSIESQPEIEAAIRDVSRNDVPWLWSGRLPTLDDALTFARSTRERRPEVARAHALSLANIRKGAAKDAINAVALYEVAQALQRRRIPLRSEIIADGMPKRYVWRRNEHRFIPSAVSGDELELVLLGPSRSLVRKHWNRLPVADAAFVAFRFLSEIKSITPSNQLSYIARIGFAGQGILISGDAGCVDFQEARGQYYPALLNAMLPLHVVQIAHHAGNNAHFYRVLAAAKFPEQDARSLLLLSHAANDRTRPSPEFREFLLGTLRQGDDVRLLFTSHPTRDKVADYLAAIHPVVGAPNTVGDVRIAFNGQRWDVKSHAVSP